MRENEPPVRTIAWVAVGTVAVLLAVAALVLGLLHRWQLPPGGETGSAALIAPIPEPKLQTAPQQNGSAGTGPRVEPTLKGGRDHPASGIDSGRTEPQVDGIDGQTVAAATTTAGARDHDSAGASASASASAGAAISGDASDVPAFRQRLGTRWPAGLSLLDADGARVDRAALRRDGRPIVLVPAFFRCDTLCGTVAHGAIEALADTGLPRSAWRLLVASVDPHDTAADARTLRTVYAHYAAWARPAVYTGAPQEIELLVGGESATRELVRTIGFDAIDRGGASDDPAAFDIAHATGLVVLTPDGTVSRYLFGVRFEPRALRLALVDASGGRIGSLADRLVLACAHLDPTLGRRDALVLNGLRVVGLALVGGLGLFAWRHRRGWTEAAR